MKWKDKREVLMMSTKHTLAMTSTARRDKEGNIAKTVTKPDAVLY